jgi:hypothetical protein
MSIITDPVLSDDTAPTNDRSECVFGRGGTGKAGGAQHTTCDTCGERGHRLRGIAPRHCRPW